MGRHELESRRAKAIRMRRDGLSRAQIAEQLGIKGGGALSRWLKDIPPPDWTRRPRARDELRAQAVRLRLQGRSYKEIESELGVARSSLSLWLRDLLLTEEQRSRLRANNARAAERRAASIRARSTARATALAKEAAGEIDRLNERELFLVGIVAYWAEGTKGKPWNPRPVMTFINSDPGMIRLFLRWLSLLGVGKEDCRFRLSIHESADLERAHAFWSDVVGVPVAEFQRASLKRHNPRTVRRGVGPAYVGCLVVKVRRSTDLNIRLSGWWEGILANLPPH